MDFANNLRRYRNNRNLFQREFAEILKVSPSSITMYETGQREPNFTLLDQMATYFNVSTDELLGRIVQTKNGKNDTELSHLLNRVKGMQLEIENLSKEIETKLRM